MDRYKFINLFTFPQAQLSPNLREITQSLPILGVGYLDGIDLKQFDVCEDIEEAIEHINRLEAMPCLDDFPDDFPGNFDFSDAPTPAKKKLRFNVSDQTATTSSNQTSTPPTKCAPAINSQDASKPTNINPEDPKQDIPYVPNRDIFNLSMDEDDEDSKPPTSPSTTPPPYMEDDDDNTTQPPSTSAPPTSPSTTPPTNMENVADDTPTVQGTANAILSEQQPSTQCPPEINTDDTTPSPSDIDSDNNEDNNSNSTTDNSNELKDD